MLFEVHGPFAVPLYKGRNNRLVRAEEGKAFFSEHPRLSTRKGCYVFAMRAGRGLTPVYVGSATTEFGQECFTPHKLGKCNEALADYRRGRLVCFLVVAPVQRGRPGVKEIRLLETFLIQAGVVANENLLNVKGSKQEELEIAGVIRAKGRPSIAAATFRTAMKLGRR